MDLPCPICSRNAVPSAIYLGGCTLNRCFSCGFHFAASDCATQADYEDLYSSAEYEIAQIEAVRTLDPLQFRHHATYAPFFDMVKPNREGTLLDVGCGAGRFGAAASFSGWKVTGIDISEKAVAIAKDYAHIVASTETLADLKRDNRHFQVTTAFEVLEHVHDPVSLLTEMSSISSQVFCTVPDFEWKELHSTTKRDWIPPVHVGFFSKCSLREAGEQARLTHVRIGHIYEDQSSGFRRLSHRMRGKANPSIGLWLYGESAG